MAARLRKMKMLLNAYSKKKLLSIERWLFLSQNQRAESPFLPCVLLPRTAWHKEVWVESGGTLAMEARARWKGKMGGRGKKAEEVKARETKKSPFGVD
jgi:hypothetical protein